MTVYLGKVTNFDNLKVDEGAVILTPINPDNVPDALKVEGLLIYNSETNKLNFYTGSAFEAVTSA